MNKEKTYNVGDLLQTTDIFKRNVFGTIIDIDADNIHDSTCITVYFIYPTRQATVLYKQCDLDSFVNDRLIKHHPGNIEI